MWYLFYHQTQNYSSGQLSILLTKRRKINADERSSGEETNTVTERWPIASI